MYVQGVRGLKSSLRLLVKMMITVVDLLFLSKIFDVIVVVDRSHPREDDAGRGGRQGEDRGAQGDCGVSQTLTTVGGGTPRPRTGRGCCELERGE